jgi:biofilm PGA synthesis N-glycosyltransferase PgaC
MSEKSYVLITAARNEDAYIGRTIESVAAQTLRPGRWVIVSDSSTDRTDEIVESYASQYPFIQPLRLDREDRRFDFASKAHAIHAGYEKVRDAEVRFIGHVDADVSMAPDYYEMLMDKFQLDPELGLAGGFIHEPENGQFRARPFNSERSVAGAIQFFRRECYEQIGGMVPFPMGGEDAYAEIVARMKGWKVVAFPELKVHHHKQGLVARGVLREAFHYGEEDYALGSHPVFEVVKCARRLKQKPSPISSLLRMCGFLWLCCLGYKRPVSDQVVAFVRNEQMARIRSQVRAMRERFTKPACLRSGRC